MSELAGAEPANFEALRKEWIKKQLKLREAQFTNTFNIKCVEQLLCFAVVFLLLSGLCIAFRGSPLFSTYFSYPLSYMHGLPCSGNSSNASRVFSPQVSVCFLERKYDKASRRNRSYSGIPPDGRGSRYYRVWLPRFVDISASSWASSNFSHIGHLV